MIFNRRPKDWKELQNFVGQLFEECGFETEISKVVDLVRGKKEIDVYTQDLTSEYKPIILIECKFWNKPINQETIHAFRTVVADFGANIGFIVSKKGFQSGSKDAVKNTNIKLVSLEELENEYYNKWTQGMVKKYMHYADILFPYWDPAGGKMPKDGKPISWDEQQLLNEAFRPFLRLGPWDLMHDMGGFKREYPMKLPVLDIKFEIIGEIVINNDRDYFDFVEHNKDKALQYFQKLYRE